jgi:prepilin-type N-terminal cleavage/methylation domain-containing protein
MFRKPTAINQCRDLRQRGFSVVEMTVVLLVIAIIAAFAVPQIVAQMKMYRLGMAARSVATALQRARYLATSDNKRTGINIAEFQRIEIEQYDPEGLAEPRNRGAVILPEGIGISDDAPRKVAFDGRGVVTPLPRESPAIRINGSDGYYTIVTVSPTGQVTIAESKRQ